MNFAGVEFTFLKTFDGIEKLCEGNELDVSAATKEDNVDEEQVIMLDEKATKAATPQAANLRIGNPENVAVFTIQDKGILNFLTGHAEDVESTAVLIWTQST